MSLKKLFLFLKNRITESCSYAEQIDNNSDSLMDLDENEPYLEKVASENNAEYDSVLKRVYVSSLNGRVENLEKAYRVISDIYDCSDMMYDRFTKNWFFNIKGIKKKRNN